MNAAVLKKDDFVVDQELVPPADAVEAVGQVAEKPGLPFGLKLPQGRAVFDAAWPPVAGDRKSVG